MGAGRIEAVGTGRKGGTRSDEHSSNAVRLKRHAKFAVANNDEVSNMGYKFISELVGDRLGAAWAGCDEKNVRHFKFLRVKTRGRRGRGTPR